MVRRTKHKKTKSRRKPREKMISLSKDVAPALARLGILGYRQAKKHVTRENLRKAQAKLKSEAEKLKKASKTIKETLKKKPKNGQRITMSIYR